MKKEISLEDAKKSLESDKVFINYNGDKFTMPQYGKYQPGLTFEFSTKFMVGNTEDQYISDLKFRPFKKYTDGMNMDFDGDPQVLFGNFRTSQSGKPVFSITDPKDAKNVMVQVEWGGAFDSTRGQHSDSEEAKDALYFHRASSNGGGVGRDYYVLDVGHVQGRPDRDVTEYLETMSDTIAQEEASYAQRRREILAEKIKAQEEERKIQENKEIYKKDTLERFDALKQLIENSSLPKDQGLLKEIMEAQIDDDGIKIGGSVFGRNISFGPYGTERVDEFIKKISDAEKNYVTYKDAMKPYEEILAAYDIHIVSDKDSRQIAGMNYKIDYDEFRYDGISAEFSLSKTGIESLEMLTSSALEMEKKKELEQNKKLLEMQEQARQHTLDVRGKKAGCPSNFLFYHNEGDTKDLSVAIVIDEHGRRRFNDDVKLDNQEDLRTPDYLHDASGMQFWRQIHEHEAVISFEQNAVGDLLSFHPVWMPEFLTEAQKEAILSFANDYAERYNAPELVTNGGRIIRLDEVIQTCNDKLVEQEIEMSKAYDEFKNIEDMLKYAIDSPSENDDRLKLAEKYQELSEKYGFEKQLEIKLTDEPIQDIKNERNDFNMDK